MHATNARAEPEAERDNLVTGWQSNGGCTKKGKGGRDHHLEITDKTEGDG